MKIKRILSMALALVLLLSCVPAVASAEETATVTGFRVLKPDELPALIDNPYFSPDSFDNTSRYGVHSVINALELEVAYSDGSVETVGRYDTVCGESIHVSYDLQGPGGEKNQITVSLFDFEETVDLTFMESPVESIEVLAEPELVLGEHEAALKVGDQRLLTVNDHFSHCLNGLCFQINYTNGESVVLNHEELEYFEEVQGWFLFPQYDGYSVEAIPVIDILGEEFGYFVGSFGNEEGIVPMYLYYMGARVEFNAYVVEGPVAKVIADPNDTTALPREEVDFQAGITGPDLIYQWQYRENAEAEWKELDCPQANTSSISIYVDIARNGYQYRCFATDANGKTVHTEPATLTVDTSGKIQNCSVSYELAYQLEDLTLDDEGVYRTPEGAVCYIALNVPLNYLGRYTLSDYVNNNGWDFFDLSEWEDLLALTDESGYAVLTDQSLGYLITTITGNPAWGETREYAAYYLAYDVAAPADGWHETDDGQCYVLDGVRLSGWQKIDGSWYYLDNNGIMQTGLKKIDGKIYNLGENGVMQTGWQKIDGQWYYFASEMKTGWQKVDNTWYYLDGDGVMQTGWQKIDGVWYYLGSNGAMATGWQKIDGVWYYLGSNGAMATGWQKIDGAWYYLGSNGAMATGWQKIDGKWYYLANEMKTGWQKVGGTWYYLANEMKTGWQKIEGNWYFFSAGGAMQIGWQKIDGTWYYLNSGGAMLTGTHVIDGKTYVFSSNGAWIG